MSIRVVRRPAIGCVTAGLLLLLIGSATADVILLNLDFQPDGSYDPPGDRLAVECLFPGEVKEIDVLVRAYRVDSVTGEATPIQSKRPATQDPEADGSYLGKFRVTAGEDDRGSGQFSIAYSDLALEAGRHQIGYEVTGRSDRVEFVRATRLTTLSIGDEDRALTSIPVEQFQAVEVEAEQEILIVDGTDTRIRRFTERTLNKVALTEERDVRITIPNGFARAELTTTANVSTDSEITLEDEVAKIGQEAWVPLSDVEPEASNRLVYFATNRQPQPTVRSCDDFTTRIGDVTYGSLLVNIPLAQFHHRGNLEQPRWWNRRDPRKYFLVEGINRIAQAQLAVILQTTLSERDALVFVHGYNNDMEFAGLRLAQLAHDANFRGVPLLFSWPSEGNSGVGAYTRDQVKAKASDVALAEVLALLVKQRGDGGGKIHILAHSMGNLVLMRALSRLNSLPPRSFGHILLVAADVDYRDAVQFYSSLDRKADSLTLYFCDEDKALKVSRRVNQNSRIGELGLFGPPNLQNIDCSKANTSFIGHDYFVSRSELLIDLELLFRGTPPSDRPTIRPRTTPPPPNPPYAYWAFP